MRIAIFCPTYGALGGIERIAASLVTEFSRQGHEVAVLARPDATLDLGPSVLVFRELYRALPGRRRRALRLARLATDLPRVARATRSALADWRADVVLGLAAVAYAPYPIVLARSCPVVPSLQMAGPDFDGHPLALRLLLRRATRVIACASSLAERARALVPATPSRVICVPNGVDAELFGAEVPPYPHARPYVLAVGRLVPQKGFDVLLDAWARVVSAGPGADLLVAGDGPERATLEVQARRLGIAGRVRFLGETPAGALPPLYRGAVCLACPSRWEGLPLVCLEAMASGCPVVGCAVDGIPDVVVPGQTGILVPPADADVLAAALSQLLGDGPGRTALGASARAVAHERFAWPRIGRQYLAVLRDAAGAAGD